MKIRKARLKDVPGIVDLWKEFMKEHADIVMGVNPKLKPYTIRRRDAKDEFGSFARKNIRSRNGGVVVAEKDGKLIGYTLFFIKKGPSVYTENVFGYISDLFVKRYFRDKGISSLFRDEGMKFFRKKGIKHSSIMVSPTNTHARNVYKKWGFQEYLIEMRRKI